MTELIKKSLDKYVSGIENTPGKSTLIVLKGWFKDDLGSIDIPRLFDKPLNITIQELFDSKPELLVSAVSKLSTNPVVIWCTYEEYMLLEDTLSMFYNVRIVRNNIFYKTYPSIYAIQYESYIVDYFKSDSYSTEDTIINEALKKLQFFYGDVNKINDSCYVTFAKDANFPEDSIWKAVPYDLVTLEGDMHTSDLIELTEDEGKLLELINLLFSRNYSSSTVNFAYSTDLVSELNEYKQRVAILKNTFKDSISFYAYTKVTENNNDYDEDKYIKILKKYWGYDSFRSLKMYKNVNDAANYNQITEILQSQIINDIVVQAERALNSEEDEYFRDIFVTSPTGAGKSVMFQVPAIYLAEKYNAMTIVISPLIGLMVDQVEGLHNKKISIGATINSEITPIQKIEIRNKIKNNEISILYISPETLLSRSDIVDLIGDRKVGLFVIDEAHIVTTWGKSFRADYWYLGNYLQKLRNRKDKKMNFPIATFTATAIYGGPEDMYKETRDSLNLLNPVSYFGYVKRDDIEVKLKCSKRDDSNEKSNEYRDKKYKITTKRLEAFVKANQKTLVYFPTVTLIYDFIRFVNTYGSDELKENISIYHGQLEKLQKNEYYLSYKNNDTLIMLATKAFGMGIDIPDIKNVYHFAPTGNVCDYVQEIGRAARALDKGYAYLDYLSKDFTHVNRLHGISTLRKNQLVQMVDKILNIYEKNGENRNLLISTEEFKHIFASGNSEDTDTDNKVKTALLILEKDFQLKLKYSPLVGRPRSLFTTDYFVVPYQYERSVQNDLGAYIYQYDDDSNNFKDTGKIYACDMKGIWEAKYKNLSFAQFKYKFYTTPEDLNLKSAAKIIPVLRIDLDLKANNYNEFNFKFRKLIGSLEDVFGSYARTGSYFNAPELAQALQKLLKENKYYCENLIEVIINCMQYYQRLQRTKSNFYKAFLNYHEAREKYSIQNTGYADFFEWLSSKIDYLLKQSKLDTNANKYKFYITKPRDDKKYLEQIFITLGLIETMGLALYETNGGDNPQIYVRINSKLQLERVVNTPDKYENQILNNVRSRHKMSVNMLKYLFENETDSETFWNLIEDYFLGRIPENVLQ